MDLGDPFVFGFTRFNFSDPPGCAATFQLLQDGPESIGRLRMPGSHVVVEIRGMIDEACRAHSWDRSTQESA